MVAYTAFDHVSEKLVTIQTAQDKYLNHKDLIESFLEQSRIVMKLRECPHIVRAERVARVGGKPYIFWEYVDGWTLIEEIQKHRLDLIRSLDVAIQFCDGMDYVHNVDLGDGRKGIVHRGIKPENIMLTKDCVLKITDFGLVKALGAPSAGRPVGTPEYMSPEQFHTTDVDQRSDIYSFGVVLYEMLTGIMPFLMPDRPDDWYYDVHRARWMFYERQHTEVPPKLPRQINHLIPVALEQAVLKCLEKNPDDRYLSFRELREKLMEVELSIISKLSLRLLLGAGIGKT